MMYAMPPHRRNLARRTLKEEDGFSLIELLVVMIILGLLAAIALAAFSGQKDKAHDADAKTSARGAQLAMESYFVDNKTYAGATVPQLQSIQPALSNAPGLTVQSATANTFQLSTSSTSTTSVTFSVARSANGTIARTCTPPNTGGCRAGVW
jgi:type IV pilus assembly protein PilA